MANGTPEQVSWQTLRDLCQEAKRHKDLEVRSAILDDLVEAIEKDAFHDPILDLIKAVKGS